LLSHPKGGGATRDEGTVGGIPFKEDPNAPRPCYRRPGKEVPPERARTNQRKKDGPLAGGMPEKNTETCFDKMERIRLPLVKTMPAMHGGE
jgi:hypothetical protein